MHSALRIALGLLALGLAPLRAANFSQPVIDAAVAEPLMTFVNTPGNELQNAPMERAKAVFYLALVAHHDPDARATDDTLVRARLVQQLKNFAVGGREPNANGSLSGWTHGSIACALALAKHTPAVWSQLTSGDVERLDWIMRALAVAGHFSFDDDNHYLTGLGYEGNFNKNSNPNYREGYVGVVIAASLYFGATELNDIFLDFDYDAYIAKFTQLGFVNILARWNHDDVGDILMDGGPLSFGGSGRGSGAGVRNTFTYRGAGLDDPFGLFKKLADYMYGSDDTASAALYPVATAVLDGLVIDGATYSYTNGTATSPHLGEPGMALELRGYQGSTQSPSPRSSLKYAADGWNNSVSTRATIEALGRWQASGEAAAFRDDVEARMRVGSDDLIFKNAAGFVGWSGSGGGSQNAEIKERLPDKTRNLGNTGYLYNKDIWLNYLKALPGGFKNTDVGAVGRRGRTTYDPASGAYSVSASGAVIGGPADAFRFVHQTVDADVRLVARLDSLASGGSAGLMLREGMDSGARGARILRTPSGVRFSHRAVAGGLATESAAVAFSGPVWLRLSRSGHVFSGHASADGATWVQIGSSATIEAPAMLHGGLAHCSGAAASLASAAFSRVSIESLPTGWQTRDIGSVVGAGHARFSDGVFGVVGSGSNIWGSADSFRFAYRPLAGDGMITARVTSVERTHADAKGGLMIRSTLDANSPHAMINLRNGKGVNLVRRSTPGGASASTPAVALTVPCWLRLARTGESVAAHYSVDGVNWTLIDTVVVPGATVHVGLAYCSLANGVLGRATFDRVQVDPTPGPPSAGVRVTGAIISSPAAGGRGPERAFDGSLSTSFGATSAQGGWVGLDLGSPRRITEVRYAPRSGYAARMRGAVVQGANRPDFTDATILGHILAEPPGGALSSLVLTAPGAYRYVRYLGAHGAYCDVAELEFFTRSDLREWRRVAFGDPEGTGPAADTADPDGDGLPNLLAYAFGADPLTPGEVRRPEAGVVDGSLELAFARVGDPALVYAVQAAGALETPGSWSEIWTSTGPDNTPGLVAVPDIVPLSQSPRRFMRIEVRH